jgi:hypothetical protein
MSFFAPDAVYDLSDAGLETVKRMKVKRMKGFEPSTFAMARRRSSQLSYIREVAPF